jgi:hypothetical protein
MMNRPIILGLISDVLTYYLKRIHDNVAIQNKLVIEERLFLGIVQNLKQKIENKQQKQDVEKMYTKLLKDGIPILLIKHVKTLTIKVPKE